MIDENVLEQVRSVSLQSIVSQFIKLKRNGSSMLGACPFHDENTPSFSVHPTKGFKCFGCGASGRNAIDFVMMHDRCGFAQAAERVASMSSIFMEHSTNTQYQAQRKPKPIPPPFNPTIIPASSIRRFEINYSRSFLFSFFAGRFGTAVADKLFRAYGVGACNLHRDFSEGATTLFIQRDIQGRVRQMNAIPYDPRTAKRRKEDEYKPKKIGLPHMKWQGVPEEDIYLVQCFFGEHLLAGNNKPVAIVESEKTAMVASLYHPDFIWLATGGSFGVGLPRPDPWGVLKGRKVKMYPDADKLYQWIDIAAEYEDVIGDEMAVHDIMDGEPIPEGFEKWDLADILLTANEPLPPANGTPLNIDSPLTYHQGNRYYFPEPEFKGIELSTFYLSDGRSIDILLTSDEEFISEPTDQVKAISKEYRKDFIAGFFYGYPCLLHRLN